MNKKEILNRYSNEDEKILMAKVMDKIEFTLNRNTIENTDFLDLYQKELVKDLLRNIEFIILLGVEVRQQKEKF